MYVHHKYHIPRVDSRIGSHLLIIMINTPIICTIKKNMCYSFMTHRQNIAIIVCQIVIFRPCIQHLPARPRFFRSRVYEATPSPIPQKVYAYTRIPSCIPFSLKFRKYLYPHTHSYPPLKYGLIYQNQAYYCYKQ